MKKDSGQKPRKQGFDPKDIVNDHIPCVYGPPDWYDSHGNLDDSHPSARRFREWIRKSKSATGKDVCSAKVKYRTMIHS